MADFGISEALALTAASTAAEAGTAAAIAAPVAASALPTTAALLAAPSVAGTALSTTALTAAEAAAAAGTGLSAYLPSLGTIGTVSSIAGTGISAISGMRNAEYQAAVARAQAAGLKQKADQEAAAGEQSAIQRQRQSDYVQSQYRARSASSGATPTGADTTLEDIAGQGQYNTLASLYQGLTASAADRRQADIDLFGATNIEGAAPIAAAGTVLAGLSSFADKRARQQYYIRTGADPGYAL